MSVSISFSQVLSKEGTESQNLCTRMMERGECPPLMVVYDPLEGFTVEADEPIEALTIIAEYVGDVDYVKNRENDEGNNNMMTLLYAFDPSQSLIICPNKRSNIAHFISRINKGENVPFLLILSRLGCVLNKVLAVKKNLKKITKFKFQEEFDKII
ncbi:histone-lysine N-methyltransferase ATXR6-like protein [Medicago truncatula]|uniref:Histone-lysine N-methyltransferase ATXR6-like protein n=2 Tax=Medicago truncatula TaxID=3880 RepID=G7L983_MEDTR|nr:histone-lysine N-methyltransferase ATXR6-like protein [Medicago truncatula]